MIQTFVEQKSLRRDPLDWGSIAEVSGPISNAAQQIVTLDVELNPGGGHNFHKHPRQEEVIYVLQGKIEQWVGKQMSILGPGDAAFIPADCVHASFNIGEVDAKVLAILGPAVGESGYEVEEMADQAPWRDLR